MSNTTKGMFFVETNGDSPYAMGKWTESIKPNNNSVDMNLNYESIIEATDDMETSSSRVERLLISTNQWEKLNYHFNDPYSEAKGSRVYRSQLHGVEGNQERATIASSSDDDVLLTTENPFSKSFWNELSKGRKDVL